MARVSTVAKKSLYVEAISNGQSVTSAAKYAGVDRTLPYVWERNDAKFAERLAVARRARMGQLKDKAFEMALDGDRVVLNRLLDRYEDEEARAGAAVQQVGEVVIIMPGEDGEQDGDHDFVTLE